ncbi:MAG: TetR/AcrR family transcriptional regulator [Nitrospinota bacterium]
MARGRPQEFDREAVLKKAMELFWAQGYQAAGMQALTEHMGISKQSLYNTFGDKHRLLQEAIDHYSKYLCQRWSTLLDAPGSPLKNLEEFFKFIESYLFSKDFRGCLMANTALEMGHKDPVIQKLLKKRSSDLDKVIEGNLQRAIQKGELKKSTDAKGLTLFIINILRGIMVTVKGGGSKAEIKNVLASLRTHLKQFEQK